MKRLAVILLLISIASTASAAGVDREFQQQINVAIERGVQYLLGLGHEGIRGQVRSSYPGGATALTFYTLLMSGVPSAHPELQSMENQVRSCAWNTDRTYTLSLALLGLLAAGSDDSRAPILEIIARLEAGQLTGIDAGAWGYAVPKPPRETAPPKQPGEDAPDRDRIVRHWDHSNTQYAVLALRSAMDFGYTVDSEVFRQAARHFLDYQNLDGGFGYNSGSRLESYTSMTAGACGSLAMCADVLGDGKPARMLRRKVERALKGGSDWLAANLEFPPRGNAWPFYAAYGVERLGHYAHVDRFGKRRWYEEGARWLVAVQLSDGSWASATADPRRGRRQDRRQDRQEEPSGDLVDTCFALLFLKRASFVHTQVSDEVFILLRGIDSQARPGDLDVIRGRILEAGEYAVPQLVKGLYLSARPARQLAAECLRRLTGHDCGYSSAGTDEQERQARDAWVQYLLSHPEYGSAPGGR